jgi:hypothetical protein
MTPNVVRGREAYTVGIVCALVVEKAAAVTMLDDKHERWPPASGDENDYTFGMIGALRQYCSGELLRSTVPREGRQDSSSDVLKLAFDD